MNFINEREERKAIASLLLDANMTRSIRDQLCLSDFAPKFRPILEAYLQFFSSANGHVTLESFCSWVKSTHVLDKPYRTLLKTIIYEAFDEPQSVEASKQLLLHLLRERKLLQVQADIIKAAQDPTIPITDIAQKLLQADTRTPEPIVALLDNPNETLSQIMPDNHGEGNAVATGISWIDDDLLRHIGGLLPGMYGMIVGAAKSYKTTFLMSIFASAVILHGKTGLYFSMEGNKKLVNRSLLLALNAAAGIDVTFDKVIVNPNLAVGQLFEYVKSNGNNGKHGRAFMLHYPQHAISVANIEHDILRVERDKNTKLDFIIVDMPKLLYLQKAERYDLSISLAISQLIGIGARRNVTIWGASQAHVDTIYKPMLEREDVADCKAQIAACDLAIGISLLKDSYTINNNGFYHGTLARLAVLANRNGPGEVHNAGVCEVVVDKERNRVIQKEVLYDDQEIGLASWKKKSKKFA